jgi:hypothetical protein
MVTKKRSTKSTSKKKSKKIINAKPDQYFILVTGVPLKNLKELANSLETMNDWVFNHHVNDSRNDFSSWISEILKEENLAKEVKNIHSIRNLELRLFKHMVNKYL